MHETWFEIFTDRNHIIAELLWTVIQDVLIVWFLYGTVFKKYVLPNIHKNVHEEIDKEHGIVHLNSDEERWD
jgi:hypothetical protein